MSDDNCVIISSCNPSAELFTVLGFKIFLCCDKDIRRRIELQILSRPLFGQVIWYNKQRLVTKPKPFRLLCCRYHFKSFSCSDCVCKKCISSVKDMSNRIFLMFPEFNFRIHTIEDDMTSIILTRSDAIEFLIVRFAKPFPSFRVRPYPVLKFLLNHFLLRLSNRCFLFIQDSLFLSLIIFDIIKDTHIF